MPRLVAWKVVCLNDIEIDGHYVTLEGPTRYGWAGGGYQELVPPTPEERYGKVLAWVREQLAQ